MMESGRPAKAELSREDNDLLQLFLSQKGYLKTHPKVRAALYGLGIAAILGTSAATSFGVARWSTAIPIISLLGYGLILTLSALESFEPEGDLWEAIYCLSIERCKETSLRLWRVVVTSAPFIKMCALICGVTLISIIEQITIKCFVAGGILAAIGQAFVAGIIPPLLSALLIWTSAGKRVSSQNPEALPKKSSALSNQLRQVARRKLPYVGVYFGYLTFLLIACIAPNGLGPSVASWLQASAADANIGKGDATSVGLLATGTALVIAGALYNATAGLAMRLGCSYQIFLNRMLVNRDSLLDALIETTGLRSATILLPDRASGVKTIFSIMSWLVFCYAALFSLVAFCPAPLGTAITGWLQGSLVDANLHIDLNKHNNVRLFLASVCAAYGAVPVAVMSCAFLPQRKPKALTISAQGILCTPGLINIIGISPLKPWSSLREISLKTRGQIQYLSLSFGWADSITIRTEDFDKAQLNELLLAADEFAPSCKLAPEVIALRSRLIEEVKENAATEADKFNSTIFSPRKGGDYLSEGRYRIVRKLSGQALTAVYLARDPQHKHVVIKEFVLPTNARQKERMLVNFEREFALLSTLDHPSIAKVLDLFEDGEARYIALEFVQGSNLRSLVERRGARNESNVRRMALDIARTIQFLHQHDPPILHRDLTPDNLMEDENGQIKLIDFGAAHQFLEGVTGTLIGKQCYISPEQLRGKASVRSDIYSFGGTLYFLLTGKDPAALTQCDLSGQRQVSNSMAAIISKCTSFDESGRYQSFAEVIRELEERDGSLLNSTQPEAVNSFLNKIAGIQNLPLQESKDANASLLLAQDEPDVVLLVSKKEHQIHD